MHLSSILNVAALASTSHAQMATHCAGGACYSINVPASTAATGTGAIFFQITGSSTELSWIGLGQGDGMAGANIFVIHQNAAGTNVTLSPRMGLGEFEPKSGSSMAEVELLDGSGIANGTMTANIKCSNCNSWSGGTMNFTDANSNWIIAMLSGSPVLSDEMDARLTYHTYHANVNFNLQMAAGGSSVNPFTAAATSSSPPSTMSGSSSSSSTSSMPSNFMTIRLTHGVLMGIAFVILMPFGGIAMRTLSFKGLIWVHAGWMVFAYLMALAAMGLGIWLAKTLNYFDKYHAIIGFVAIGALLLQPFTGFVHHLIWKRKGGPNVTTYLHAWWGRAAITLAMINGGLGLQLTQAYQPGANKGIIIWSVVAGVIWLFWMAVVAFSFFRSRGKGEDRKDSIVNSSDGEKGQNGIPTEQQ